MATTKITNTSGATKYFGFIPPHGASLASGANVTINGDLRSILASGKGRYSRKLELASIATEEAAGRCTILQNVEDDTPAPTFVSITPNSGLNAGGLAVAIVGTRFTVDATVMIGGAAATSVVVVSPTSITCVTPAHVADEATDVVITNGDASTVTGVGAFTYA